MNTVDFWWLKGLIGFAVLVLIQYLVKRVLAKVEKTKRLGKIFNLPLTVLIWIVGAAYLLEEYGLATEYLNVVRKVAVISCITWIVYRWKHAVVLACLEHSTKRVDSTTIYMINRLASVAIAVLSGLIILQILGVNTAPLLAFGSIGAAAIGFAGKDVMANFCSGMMLYITRPFTIGDQIFLPEKDLTGHIEEIGWFRTSIRDKEKRAVYLPNNFFSTMILVNVSRMTHRRISQHFHIAFDHTNKISEIVDKMKDHLQKSSGIDTRYPVHVFLKAFGDYACDIEVEAYSTITDQADFNHFQHQTLLDLEAILQAMRIPLAIPTAKQVRI